MNERRNQNFKKEQELEQGSIDHSFQPLSNVWKSIQEFYQQFLKWFQELPQWGKIIALIVIPLLTIKILEAIINFVSLLISIVIFGGFIYIGYRFLILPTYSGKKQR